MRCLRLAQVADPREGWEVLKIGLKIMDLAFAFEMLMCLASRIAIWSVEALTIVPDRFR